jgi:hypothetical protein
MMVLLRSTHPTRFDSASELSGPDTKIGHPPLGIGNAARPAARITATPLGEAPARDAKRDQDHGFEIPGLRFREQGE